MKFKYLSSALIAESILFTGCSSASESDPQSDLDSSAVISGETSSVTENNGEIITALSKIDNTKWQYNESDDVYWQVGIRYCENPADEKYETLGIFVPGAYMNASDNGDGTFTCEINIAGTVGGYTAETAPVVIPVNTPGYSAMSAPTGYSSSVAEYTNAGFIYLNAGCRGRDHGAPAGVTDLKAAVRYFRYNNGNVPGNSERIFTFGMSGGGAQSALVGATGDSELYDPYLEAIGAVQGVSDAVAGSMCWCPITNLDYANEAYEWNMGSTRTGLDSDTQKLSDGLAEAFAEYINELGIKDGNGNTLTLTKSENGIYQAGSYYDYVVAAVERSLNNFLSDTEFPYTVSSGGGMGGDRHDGNLPGGDILDGDKPFKDNLDGDLPGGNKLDGNKFGDGDLPEGGFPGGNGQNGGMFGDRQTEIYEQDGIDRNEQNNGASVSGTYETAKDYIDALNANGEWIIYDSATNTAKITSLADFVKNCKSASKSVGAFDDLNATQGENVLFGYGDGAGAHFDSVLAGLLEGTEYEEAYSADLAKTDFLGNTVKYRMNMYNPLYYLCEYYDGCGTSNAAQYWRIRTGITQGDTALTTELNLALALENAGKDVDFETVWGLGHTEAERTGSSSENFIEWVNSCLK